MQSNQRWQGLRGGIFFFFKGVVWGRIVVEDRMHCRLRRKGRGHRGVPSIGHPTLDRL